MRKILLLLLLILTRGCFTAQSQSLYFPPLNASLPWDTLSPDSLGWCRNEIDSLYDFLGQENSKAFILLKDGKIVLEHYYDTFTRDSLWYWASAGKTITSFLVGQAQEAGQLNILDSSSKYLGAGWTICTPQQEGRITIRHQLTMTSGLDDGVADNHCTIDTCLVYLADAGTRWAYHNAPYTLLEKIIENASGQNINTFTQINLRSRTGMNGLWFMVDYDNVYFSNARSMARFGLMIQNNGIWNSDTLLHDTAYVRQMTNTSQLLNLSYGYLWWLNGKPSYMLPTSQFVFSGSYAPDAPSDMFSALGKNGQILSISKSRGLVFIRMGDPPNSPSSEIATLFCNQIWQHLNSIMCSTTSLDPENNRLRNQIYPNPVSGILHLNVEADPQSTIDVTDLTGKVLLSFSSDLHSADVSSLAEGVYLVRFKHQGFSRAIRFVRAVH